MDGHGPPDAGGAGPGSSQAVPYLFRPNALHSFPRHADRVLEGEETHGNAASAPAPASLRRAVVREAVMRWTRCLPFVALLLGAPAGATSPTPEAGQIFCLIRSVPPPETASPAASRLSRTGSVRRSSPSRSAVNAARDDELFCERMRDASQRS